jgi:hypothetical protein
MGRTVKAAAQHYGTVETQRSNSRLQRKANFTQHGTGRGVAKLTLSYTKKWAHGSSKLIEMRRAVR